MKLRENYGILFTGTVLSASLAVNVALAVRLQGAKTIQIAGFQAGAVFPQLIGTSPEGSRAVLDLATPTLVYVFSPNCGWCKADRDNLVALADHAQGRYRVVGVTLTNNKMPAGRVLEMDEYLRTYPFPGEVILVDPDHLSFGAVRSIRVTPQTLVIAAGGTIEQAWVGALTGAREHAAEQFFRLALPGVRTVD